ncbi:MAG: GTPase [Candidatus Woesearchaeota archaeon]
MKNYQNMVNDVIKEADILLLLLDARFVEETMHVGIENKAKRENKPLIYVITKSDLVDTSQAAYKKLNHPCVFVSAKMHQGLGLLRQAILVEAQRNHLDNPIVGVLGYPNVGKSSLINALKGHQSASTSCESGHTRHIQKIKIDNRITLLDAPGTIPYTEKNKNTHAMIGAIDFNKAEEPDLVVMELMLKFPGRIEAYYDVGTDADDEQRILDIGKKNNILKKGGEPDLLRTSRVILKDWQMGKISELI